MKEFIKEHIDVKNISCVVSGGAKGADSLGSAFATEHDIEIKVYKPDWARYGRGAGMIRNAQIIEESDVVFACWDGMSKGTKNSINMSIKKGKELHVYRY